MKIKRNIFKITFFVFILITFYNCKGTISTVTYSNSKIKNYKSAYIISSENSEYIKFKFGELSYGGYLPPKDYPAEKLKRIGNTDTIIKRELEKYGILSIIGKKGDTPENFDLIIKYTDKWRWDFKNILDELKIYFISKEGNKILAKSTFNIYKNKELHNFPIPKKVVPKMIKELLDDR
mgnify:CR=1 FL=1|tara:strand:- start:4906 stop:5442 length:537 start_codon:yes stop_codon:yes gene_type:complete